MVNATVIGARGYLGRELVRLLLHHPQVDAVVPVSQTEAGRPYGDAVPALRHTGLRFHADDDPAALDADIAFLATPAGAAAAAAAKAYQDAGAKLVVDLSRDHRIAAIAGGPWHYGVADLSPAPKGTRQVANAGCYPTAALTALTPALAAGLLAAGPLIVDGKSGVSGAGATPRADLHFPEANESVRAYKVIGHDHTEEIRHAAARIGGTDRPVRFTPHLVPQTRGLLCTVYAPVTDGTDGASLQEAYAAHYADAPFVRVVPEPDTASVRGSNFADVAVDLDPACGLLVARCAIDNLQKGGSGSAIQHANSALGYPIDAGLQAVGGSP